jgi:hypothetical protein
MDGDIAEFNTVAGQNELCTLVEMNVDFIDNFIINGNDYIDGTSSSSSSSSTTQEEVVFSNLKPVGRSYNGNEWEVAPGQFSKIFKI